MTEPDRIIDDKEAEEIFKSVQVGEMSLSFEDKSIIVDVEDEDVKLEFVSLRESPSIQVSDRGAWTTVSRYLIHVEGETLEVETDGPFKLNMEGLGVTELDAVIEHQK